MKMRNWLAAFGVLGACALCCALPLLGSLIALGVSSFFVRPLVWVGLALVFVIAGIVIYQRRKAAGRACRRTGCSCNSCSVV